MSKTDEVRKAMVEAMKAKDKETKDTLSLPTSLIVQCQCMLSLLFLRNHFYYLTSINKSS